MFHFVPWGTGGTHLFHSVPHKSHVKHGIVILVMRICETPPDYSPKRPFRIETRFQRISRTKWSELTRVLTVFVCDSVFKRRKRHRRKHFENQEPCIMRGVYYKNMKWQAAIKVDKKQIHLGTVGSQEEAARLYDRAAFMCGREPNFELTVEEKDELSKLSWDEFLTMTRSAINSKKHQRRVSSRMKFEHPSQNNGERKSEADEGGNSFSASDDAETSAS